MGLIKVIWYAFQIIAGYNLVFPLLLYVIWLIFRRKPVLRPTGSFPADYAIIVTAYEQTESLPSVVNSILKINYDNFLVYIVADKCDISSLNFNDERVILLRPPEVLGGNVRSHFYAIRHFARKHDRLTIIDSDNLVHPEYLKELNKMFDFGFEAVQGIRRAKNLDTVYSCLDAARDIYYHFYDGQLLFQLGSSATLAGSGMAFTADLYRSCLENKDVQGAGFDKVLQYEIVRRNKRIAFTESAVVYDEKTSRPEQLVNQRSRWINTWFRYFQFGFGLVADGIRRLSVNKFLFGTVLFRPPLFIFILLSALCLLINLFIQPSVALYWLAAFILFFMAFAVSLLHSETDPRIYRSLAGIPKFIWLQIISLMNAWQANKRSVATKHYHSNPINQLKHENRSREV